MGYCGGGGYADASLGCEADEGRPGYCGCRIDGSKKDLLAGTSEQNEARKHDEETDRMIREAGQNCHWIERKKETDEMSYKTESVRTEKSARLKK